MCLCEREREREGEVYVWIKQKLKEVGWFLISFVFQNKIGQNTKEKSSDTRSCSELLVCQFETSSKTAEF